MTTRRKLPPTLIAACILLAGLAAWALQATVQAVRARSTAAAQPMAAMLPQGALLTIESPNFAAVLNAWTTSPECKAWLTSDSHAVFANSRLFGRLSDAQDEFFGAAFAHAAGPKATTGGTPPEPAAFLHQIAGARSIFAWYDVGNLEFLYITRMSAAQSSQTALLAQRTRFSRRESAGQPFFVRTGAAGDGHPRTVAFATVQSPAGDLLLLATREDLMANALALIAANPAATSAASTTSVAGEPWYQEASASLPAPAAGPAPDLHMVLNLDRLVPLPAFDSYWVQQNITQFSTYRSAVSDLYREGQTFREERAILLKSPPDAPAADTNLASLAAIAPPTGVFRAEATDDPAAAITALEEKLLGREQLAKTPTEAAPDPTLDATQSGSTTDLETRIDTPPPVSANFSNQALTTAIRAANLDAVLTFSTAQLPPGQGQTGLWVPIHSAVVLEGRTPWNSTTLQQALQQSLRGTLTTATLGIDFVPMAGAVTPGISSLSGPKPLFLAIRANRAYLADDLSLLENILATPTPPSPAAFSNATLIAGFDHTSQRAPYARLTHLVDGVPPPAQATAQSNTAQPESSEPSPEEPTGDSETHTSPPFFSANLRSLSDSFARLQSERILERREAGTLRQTVTYRWQTP